MPTLWKPSDTAHPVKINAGGMKAESPRKRAGQMPLSPELIERGERVLSLEQDLGIEDKPWLCPCHLVDPEPPNRLKI